MSIKECNKRYYQKNRDKLKAHQKEWAKNNKDKVNATQRKRVRTHPELNRKHTREYNARVRKSLIELLGGKCVRCGFDDPRALQIDHIHGGGSQDVKAMTGMKNIQFMKRVLAGSTEYQLLCANCNWIKRAENNEVR
jgi:hypothetical protein